MKKLMDLPDALLNTMKVVHEPKYLPHKKLWHFKQHSKEGWTSHYFYSEEAAWKEYYLQFRKVKEAFMGINNQKGR